MVPPDRNGLHASFTLRTTETDVFVFLKKRKAADSPSFWLLYSTCPEDNGQYGTWLYVQGYADIMFGTFSTLQANSIVSVCMCCETIYLSICLSTIYNLTVDIG